MRTIQDKKTIAGYVGKTMQELAQMTSQFWYPVRVFVLNNDQDNTGTPTVTGYTLKTILNMRPSLSSAVVKFAEFYYGEIILRVSMGLWGKIDELDI